MPTMFEEEPKARCPDCSQSLTFIRTKSHQKRWYCYACEKYVDRIAEPTMVKDAHARIEAITGLQVIDSHGMIVGRVRKAISNDTGDVRSLVLSVDKEQFKSPRREGFAARVRAGTRKNRHSRRRRNPIRRILSKRACTPQATFRRFLEYRQVLKMQRPTHRGSKTLHQMRGIVDLCLLRIMRNTEPNRS